MKKYFLYNPHITSFKKFYEENNMYKDKLLQKDNKS